MANIQFFVKLIYTVKAFRVKKINKIILLNQKIVPGSEAMRER